MKFSVFHKEWPFLAENVFVSDFLVQIRNQCLKIELTSVPNFSQIGQNVMELKF